MFAASHASILDLLNDEKVYLPGGSMYLWARSRPGACEQALTRRPARVPQGQLPRPTDIMSLRIDNGERTTVELSDIVLSPTRYIASWLRQRGWKLPENRRALGRRPPPGVAHAIIIHGERDCT
jgi:hypothetical protein